LSKKLNLSRVPQPGHHWNALAPAAQEIRNPKHEIRNKSKAEKKKARNRGVPFRAFFFGFSACFGFRASDFVLPATAYVVFGTAFMKSR
jgi:hypothetical protein